MNPAYSSSVRQKFHHSKLKSCQPAGKWEGVSEQGAENNIWNYECWSYRMMEEELYNTYCLPNNITYLLIYLLTYLFIYLLTFLLTYLLTYLLTPRNSVLLKKPTRFQLVKKFPAFYGTRRFINAFTSSAKCPYPEPAQSSPYPHILLPEDPYPLLRSYQSISPGPMFTFKHFVTRNVFTVKSC